MNERPDRTPEQAAIGLRGGLNDRVIAAINQLMLKGYSMRQAKRILGVTKKNPIVKQLKRKEK